MTTRACAQCGESFTPRPDRAEQPFCSLQCAGLAKRKRVSRSCEACGKTFEARPCEIAAGRGRYCSPACRHASLRRRAERACARCGKTFEVPLSMARNREFCSWACYLGPEGGMRDVECRICGKPMRVNAASLAHGRGKFCSRGCYWQSRRKPAAERTCVRCRTVFAVHLNAARKGRFCSRACYLGRGEGMRDVECQTCGKPTRVKAVALGRGRGKFCSRRCYGRSRRKPRVRLHCGPCGRFFSVHPSTARRGRRFHSRACWNRQFARLVSQCSVCGTPFESRPWRKRRFCTLSCSNKGRRGERYRDVAARNRRILELREEGLWDKAIWQRLKAEDAEWGTLALASIRSVVRRERRRAAGL